MIFIRFSRFNPANLENLMKIMVQTNSFANLTLADVYYDTLPNVNDCDSVICLTLMVDVGIAEMGHAPSLQ